MPQALLANRLIYFNIIIIYKKYAESNPRAAVVCSLLSVVCWLRSCCARVVGLWWQRTSWSTVCCLIYSPRAGSGSCIHYVHSVWPAAYRIKGCPILKGLQLLSAAAPSALLPFSTLLALMRRLNMHIVGQTTDAHALSAPPPQLAAQLILLLLCYLSAFRCYIFLEVCLSSLKIVFGKVKTTC